jgi:hypothetical protein
MTTSVKNNTGIKACTTKVEKQQKHWYLVDIKPTLRSSSIVTHLNDTLSSNAQLSHHSQLMLNINNTQNNDQCCSLQTIKVITKYYIKH